MVDTKTERRVVRADGVVCKSRDIYLLAKLYNTNIIRKNDLTYTMAFNQNNIKNTANVLREGNLTPRVLKVFCSAKR